MSTKAMIVQPRGLAAVGAAFPGAPVAPGRTGAGADGRVEAVLELGRGLHRAGAPAYRVEQALGDVSERLGLEAQFFATPTSLFASFGSGVEQTTHLLRFDPAGIDLGRMGDLDGLLEEARRPGASPAAIRARLAELEAAPARFGPWLERAACALASASAAVFFGGSPADAVAAGLLGLLVGWLGRALSSSADLRRLHEPLAAALAAAGAQVALHGLPGVSEWTVTLAAVIVLVPGLSLTVGLGELAHAHWISGAGRLAGAATTFLSLGLGLTLGRRGGAWLLGALAPEGWAPAASGAWASWGAGSAWVEPVALLLAPLAFAVLFRVRRRDLVWVLAGGTLAYLAARCGSRSVGAEWGGFLGALALGLLGNLYALGLRRPAQVILVPGLLLLVPGSIGFHSVAAFLSEDPLAGVQQAFHMLAVGGALVGGLFLAQALVPARRSL